MNNNNSNNNKPLALSFTHIFLFSFSPSMIVHYRLIIKQGFFLFTYFVISLASFAILGREDSFILASILYLSLSL